MFSFKNKKIEDFRKEIKASIGKEIKLRNNRIVTIGEVTECDIHCQEMFSDIKFQKNGEVDFDKTLQRKKMYGFFVDIYWYEVTDVMSAEYKQVRVSLKQMIVVPFEDRNKRMTIETDIKESIIN